MNLKSLAKDTAIYGLSSIVGRFLNYLFTLFIVSFAGQKLLSLIRFHLFIFVFISITLGGGASLVPQLVKNPPAMQETWV